MPNNYDGPKLPRERKAEERLEGVSGDEIEGEIRERGSSDFTSKTVEYADESKTESPFTVNVTGVAPNAMNRVHEERSERAQSVDEHYNAPVTLDEEKWVENKDRYDYPGVDTIPERKQAKRADTAAKEAKEKGFVDRVEHKGNAKTLQGKFSPKGSKTYGREDNVVRVQGNANQPERTAAHELGHAADFGVGDDRGYGLTDRLFDLETPTSQGETEELTDEAFEISQQARGDFSGQEQYRREYKELTADVVGQAIIQPQATKRDAPNLFGRLEEAAEEEDLDIFGREDEPLGVFTD